MAVGFQMNEIERLMLIGEEGGTVSGTGGPLGIDHKLTICREVQHAAGKLAHDDCGAIPRNAIDRTQPTSVGETPSTIGHRDRVAAAQSVETLEDRVLLSIGPLPESSVKHTPYLQLGDAPLVGFDGGTDQIKVPVIHTKTKTGTR